MQGEGLLSLRESIMLIRHNNSISAAIRREKWYIEHVHSVLNYSWTLLLEYNVTFFDDVTFGVAGDIDLCLFTWKVGMQTGSHYN